MNAFEKACSVEEESRRILEPFLKRRSHDGQLVWTSKGPLAKVLQETIGDGLMNTADGRVWSVELKAEQSNTHGNFFLETWSNRNLEDRNSHATRGSNVGWMQKLKADLLLYHFLDNDLLYAIDLFKLQRWAFREGNIYRYPEKVQGKYSQANDTWGRCVPIMVIEKQVGFVGGVPWRPREVLGLAA